MKKSAMEREAPDASFAGLARRMARQTERLPLDCLQINLGKLCNQACQHCHVEAGPGKIRENMDRATVDRILYLLDQSRQKPRMADLTGGAPELNPHFRYLVDELRGRGLDVWDRCNLTVLQEPGQEDLVEFLVSRSVTVVASLPCYTEDNVDSQRGDGVFRRSLEGLRLLNKAGYGREGSGLQLNLVYNPGGAFLPPAQAELEQTYKEKLAKDFGLTFNQLFTITNMPINRFAADLRRSGNYEEYMNLLRQNFNQAAMGQIMCRSLISLSWDGRIYDCDFNQMLGIPTGQGGRNLDEIDSFDAWSSGTPAFADHCFGCTAGAGSSCGGSLT